MECMRRKSLICSAIILSIILIAGSETAIAAKSTATVSKAAVQTVIPELQKQYFNVLVQLELMAKPSKSSPKLSDKIKYVDFLTILNKAMSVIPGSEAVIPSDKSKTSYITFAEAEKLLLIELGYGEAIKESNPEQILAKAFELGLSTDLKLPADKQITRGEATVLVYNSLTVDFAAVTE